MASKNAIKRRPVRYGLLLWALLSLIIVATCGFLIYKDPQQFNAEKIWVGTDRRTELAATYAGRRILGVWAWFAPDYRGVDIEKECPDLAGKVPVDSQGRNAADVLRIDVEGSLHCIVKGKSARVEDLELKLVNVSKKWMTIPDPAGGQPIHFGNAELSVQRTDQPYLAIALLVATALLGVTLNKVAEGLRADTSGVQAGARLESPGDGASL